MWLDRNKTSPYAFYQFWLNASDEDAKNYIRIFSLKNQQEIEAIESEHLNAPHLRLLQKTLANEITTRVHSQQDCDRAIEISEVFFNGTDKELAQLTESDLQDVFNGLGKNAFEVELQKIQAGIQALDLFAAETTIFTSKGEARKMITANGVSLNKLKFSDPSQIINKEQLIANKFLLIQKGKKNFFLIKAV